MDRVNAKSTGFAVVQAKRYTTGNEVLVDAALCGYFGRTVVVMISGVPLQQPDFDLTKNISPDR